MMGISGGRKSLTTSVIQETIISFYFFSNYKRSLFRKLQIVEVSQPGCIGLGNKLQEQKTARGALESERQM